MIHSLNSSLPMVLPLKSKEIIIYHINETFPLRVFVLSELLYSLSQSLYFHVLKVMRLPQFLDLRLKNLNLLLKARDSVVFQLLLDLSMLFKVAGQFCILCEFRIQFLLNNIAVSLEGYHLLTPQSQFLLDLLQLRIDSDVHVSKMLRI